MNKLFLAGVAARFLATGTAHANERAKDALPSSLSGVWCYQKFESQEASEVVDIYRRRLCFSSIACARPEQFSCSITMVPDEVIISRGFDPLVVFRHEQGHCNG
jgi:hypothetical protein